MTKAMMEPMQLSKESNKLILQAFSKENKEKVQKFDRLRKSKLQRTKVNNSLSIKDILDHY